ncbi:Stk1 family PASTA domain-containing Ser/Thr kinase [Romboutsia sp. Marseille-P6047]|uniref:Stk1 family PASTA domain-containing Ser/Thr kinase n=1 Tax=Romboutsia sp. Marseille-P6047 TaxID=2161817 RepID=UPI000F05E6B0|nr:Stk1 family PASTA domain-containing Ser/Thr kinase [Romboutsia sp. Marseille-P6047]
MGDTILGNRYQIIRKIGDGGMAFVYEAKDKLLNRTVAVKVLRPEFVDDEDFLKKFKREAEAVASLSHPNIVNVYDVGEDGKVHYIVMEYIDGQNLKDIIKNEGTLDEYTALDITKQIAMALSAAHRKGIVHRDIKPHNILISNEGRIVKVADFGIAKAVSNSTMTNVGNIIGSVHYFSPEQAKGQSVNATADLYALGIVLYEMIIGRVPFRGDSPISIALQHINDDVEFTSEEKVSIPQSVRTLIKKLTEKSSEARYQSAEELIDDIDYIEKNIDLDFIKEYDNFATKHIDIEKIEQSADIEDEDEKLIEDAPKVISKPKKENIKKKKNKVQKEDSPKVKKRLKIVAIVLGIILLVQVFFVSKFVISMLSGSSTEKQVVSLPDFSNQDLDTVKKQLEELGLYITIKRDYSDTVEVDHVISQSPFSGTEVSKGDTITIVLSQGQKQSEVPSIVGLTLTEAEQILGQNNMKLGNIKREYNSSYEEGIVIKQNPTSGSGVSSVDVVVSKGPEPVKEETNTIPEDTNNNTQTPDNNNSDNNVNNNSNNNSGNNSNTGNNNQNNGGSSDIQTPDDSTQNGSGDVPSISIPDAEGGTALPQSDGE